MKWIKNDGRLARWVEGAGRVKLFLDLIIEVFSAFVKVLIPFDILVFILTSYQTSELTYVDMDTFLANF